VPSLPPLPRHRARISASTDANAARRAAAMSGASLFRALSGSPLPEQRRSAGSRASSAWSLSEARVAASEPEWPSKTAAYALGSCSPAARPAESSGASGATQAWRSSCF